MHDTAEVRRQAYERQTALLTRALHRRAPRIYTFTDRQLEIALAALEKQERDGIPTLREWLAA